MPGSSVHVLSQARILEWVVMHSPENLPDPGIELVSSALVRRFLAPRHHASPGHVFDKNANPRASFHTYGIRRNSGDGAHQSACLTSMPGESKAQQFQNQGMKFMEVKTDGDLGTLKRENVLSLAAVGSRRKGEGVVNGGVVLLSPGWGLNMWWYPFMEMGTTAGGSNLPTEGRGNGFGFEHHWLEMTLPLSSCGTPRISQDMLRLHYIIAGFVSWL